MDETTAFDQQIAREVLREAGPSEPVDGAAILNDITAASRSRKWRFTMFSALKFVAAGVIVALFGGFLLSGVLTAPQGDEAIPAAVTESPSPTAVEGLLTGVPTVVTGNMESCATLIDGTEDSNDSVSPRMLNLMQLCTISVSDPRLSGDFINTFNKDCHIGGACVFWGTQELKHPRQGWYCHWSGTEDPATENWGRVFGVCTGNGAYEGLTYVYQHVFGRSGVGDGDVGDGTNVFGVLYAGDPPPWP